MSPDSIYVEVRESGNSITGVVVAVGESIVSIHVGDVVRFLPGKEIQTTRYDSKECIEIKEKDVLQVSY